MENPAIITDVYPKFSPSKHLSHQDEQSKCDFKIFKKSDTLYIEQFSDITYPVFSSQCVKIINWEIAKWIDEEKAARSCADASKTKDKEIFESPELSECSKKLPFLHAALTSTDTMKFLGAQLGFEILPILNYEIIHVSAKTKAKYYEDENFIIRTNSVAYPLIFLIKLTPNDLNSSVPLGHGVLLKGRVIKNLCYKFNYCIKGFSSQYLLCPSYKPQNFTNFEKINKAAKFNMQDSALFSKFKSIEINNRVAISDSSEEYDQDLQKIEKYKTWLNSYYNAK